MSTYEQKRPGSIIWHDITVPEATHLREFYEAVVGWRSEPVDVHGHEDFNMFAPGATDPVAGICHAIGDIAGLPPQWLMYTVVPDLDESVKNCGELGGAVIFGPNEDGMGGKFCVIQDPAGAVMALIQPA